MVYEAVIGLEVHAQLHTKTKIFCACPAQFGGEPNSRTCPVCLGLPGALPVLNRRVVEFASRAALALGGNVSRESIFARKSYFYPDLPKGYQITQYDRPLATGGALGIESGAGTKTIRIERIHMEEDAGRLVHDPATGHGLVDFNRAGVPLIEIVTKPDISSPDEAVAFLRSLRQILTYLGVCDGNMEEGSLRCDANVSVRRAGSTGLGPRTELKNLNSFRFIERAITLEIARQTAACESGAEITPATFMYDQKADAVRLMRKKKGSEDYRYFQEPDLQPLRLDNDWVSGILESQPELPAARRRRFEEEYALPAYDAGVLTADRDLADFFEDTVKLHRSPKTVSNWIMTELLHELGRERLEIPMSPVTPNTLAGLLSLVEKGELSGKMAREVFAGMFRTGSTALQIATEQGLRQISDRETLRTVVDSVVKAHPAEFERLRGGETKMIDFFTGAAMRATHGKANPVVLSQIIKALMDTPTT
ncbi:MAG: Asp-tRNA(Asn)/Glu-tRNA(Gln) amidotransferase subunit GatB [Myxococcota bacterium]|jgi:aspartyl-tRNA(Asn)/glutamyl-tRNA(Gln) amidotransferase subunit B